MDGIMALLLSILMSAFGTLLASLFGAGLFGLVPAEDADAPPVAEAVSVQEVATGTVELAWVC